MKFKNGDMVSVINPEGKQKFAKVISVYVGDSGRDMAQIHMKENGDNHILHIGQCMLELIEPESVVVTEIPVMLDTLRRDNEQLLDKNELLKRENIRLDNLVNMLTKMNKDLLSEKEDLKEQIKVLKKGLLL